MAAVPRQVIRSRLAERGVRFTWGRRTLVEALAAADGPRSAAELHTDLAGELPLSSLYRSLTVLEDAGVVEPHHGARSVTRYELAEWLAGHHHHLVCRECGSVQDVPVSGPVESALEGVVAAITSDTGFHPTGHTLEIEGLCDRCR